MPNSNRQLSIVSAIASVIGTFLLGFFIWDNGTNALAFWLSGLGGLLGMAIGLVDRRAGHNKANTIGLWLGLAVIAAIILLILWFWMATTTTIEAG